MSEDPPRDVWAAHMRVMAAAAAGLSPAFTAMVRKLEAEEDAVLRLACLTGNAATLDRRLNEARRRAELWDGFGYCGPDESPYVSGLWSVIDDVTRGRMP